MNFKIKALLFLVLGLESRKITCPTFKCLNLAPSNTVDNDIFKKFIEKNQCFYHDKNQPTEQIIAVRCIDQMNRFGELEDKNLCDFDLLSGKFSWVDELNQHLKYDREIGLPE